MLRRDFIKQLGLLIVNFYGINKLVKFVKPEPKYLPTAQQGLYGPKEFSLGFKVTGHTIEDDFYGAL